MSEYIVSARKYRPMTFDTVVGQGSIATTLKNAIRADKLAHAYLFCGPRGVGKTTCARIFAKTINCLNPREDGEACGECESCQAFNEGRSLNIHELDAASNNSVDDIRNLIDQVRIPPQIGRYKVFIIDEVHMLSTAAFNAFLKTLEEPPAHAVFILATTEKHKILPTILSRCQIYDFQRMTVENTVQHLAHVAEQEGYTYEPAALNVIAQKADGGMRDALSIFDQVVSYSGGNITYQQVIENLNVLDYDYYFRLVDLLLEKKIPESLLLYNEILNKGFEGGPFISGLAAHLRDLLVSRDPQTTQLLEVSDDIRQRYAEQAARCKVQWLYRAIRLCNECDQAYRTSRNKRLQVELTLIEAAQADDDEPAAGRRPKHRILKPIFSLLAAAAGKASPAAPSEQVAARPATPATPTPTPQASQTPQPSQAPQTPQSSQATPSAQKLKTFSLKNLGPSIHATSPSSGRATRVQPETGTDVQQPLSTENDTSTAADATPPTADRPVRPEDLAVQWQAFVQSMPQQETALAQRMKIMHPQIQPGDTEIDVTVESEDVIQMMKNIEPRLLQALRRELSNSHLTLRLHLAERNQPATVVYNDREALRRMCDLNPALISLGKAFKLEIS